MNIQKGSSLLFCDSAKTGFVFCFCTFQMFNGLFVV